MAYDIFISYRREGGEKTARLIQLMLEDYGYKVFLDYDSCNTDSWEKKIKTGVEESKVFLFILSRGSLDRCKNENDMVRKELEYAYELRKNIVPVDPDREFDGFPPDCPDTVREALGQHTFFEIYTTQHFKTTVRALVEQRIKDVVIPARDEEKGASIYLEADMDCQIELFDKPLCALEAGVSKEVRMRKGVKKITAISTENPADKIEKMFTVESEDIDDYWKIELRPIRDKRKARERWYGLRPPEANHARTVKSNSFNFRWLSVALVAVVVGIGAIIGVREYKNNDIVFSGGIEVVTDTAKVTTINGHEWVDLGLSVKWATCNVGASSPSDYGNYYAWGETSTKAEYTEDNSTTYGKSFGDISGNAQYDAARARWGGSWRMPTRAEYQELEDNCTWAWTTRGGRNGYKVTGKNGNSIFLPAAGWRYGSSLYNAGEYGGYWSSSPHEGSTLYAYNLYFYSGHRYVDWSYRYYGHPVRPVSE